ncbi:MAG TPA: hypothetical protein VG963_09870, partial [Polyangiaceae bacterium]|nr:hypothetical protein [Polyangiaceae bacterium]
VCGQAPGPTELYTYRDGDVHLELHLDGARRVRSSGNGALVIDAPCDLLRGSGPVAAASVSPAALGRHCVRRVSGELFDVQVSGEVGTERLAALADGRVAVVIPPRSNTPGRLSLVSPGGSVEKALSIEPSSGPGARLVRSGAWLDELWEIAPGKLGDWVVGAQAFVGVHVDLDGVVQIARLSDGVDETSFFGPHALQLAASASLRESHDHGFDWRVSEVPPALLAAGLGRVSRRPLRGCSPVGCIRDDWLRVGYGADALATEPARPPQPARVAAAGSGFAFWALDCTAFGNHPSAARPRASSHRGEASEHRASARSRLRGAAVPAEPPESSAWISLQDSAPPARNPGDLAYDFGETTESSVYRAYAWGPSRGDWSRSGRWSIKVGDQFSLAAPWSTAVTRTPWPDATSVAQTFGLDPNTGVDWWLHLGADGQAGVLQIRVRSETFSYLVDRDRSIENLLPASGAELGTLAGAQQVGDRWYLGAVHAEQFQLYRVETGKLELVGSYPLWSRLPTQLVRSVHGDELALWQKSSGAG